MNRIVLQVLGAGACLALGAPALAAQTQVWSAPAATTAPPSDQNGPARAVAVGEKVRVSSSGGWYDAKVLEVGEGSYKIHYEGWGSAWDEWVPPARMRLPNGGAVAAAPSRPAPVSPVTSPVTRTPAPARPPVAATPSPAAQPPAPQVQIWSTSPVGKWGCRTWDAGQVNRVGEFTLKADGSYQDTFYKGSGRYTFNKSSGRLTFTSGPQKTNAPIHFNPAGHAGKGHLVFDYGGGAKLDCYREALR